MPLRRRLDEELQPVGARDPVAVAADEPGVRAERHRVADDVVAERAGDDADGIKRQALRISDAVDESDGPCSGRPGCSRAQARP